MDNLEWKRTVDKTLRMLIQRTAKTPVRLSNATGGSSGGGANTVVTSGRFLVPTVEELPAVPTAEDTIQFVMWTSAGPGDGDDGVWWTRTGMTRWYPMVYSSLNGTPGATELD